MIIQINKENFDWVFYLKYHTDLLENGISSKESAWEHWIKNGIYEDREIKIVKFSEDLLINLDNIIKKENENNEILYSFVTPDPDKSLSIQKISEFVKNEEYNENKEIEENIKNKENCKLILYNNFNWKFYLNYHTDLINNKIITKDQAWKHWNNYGNNENRIAQILYIDNYSKINRENFDWIFYLDYHDDLLYKGITTKDLAWNHWKKIGIFENREIQTFYKINTLDINYNNFDSVFYINYHNDLIENGINTKDAAWNHWLNFGKKENRIFGLNIENKNIYNSFILVNPKENDYRNIYKKNNNFFGEDKYNQISNLIKESHQKILNEIIFDKIYKIKIKNYEKIINKMNLNNCNFRLYYLNHKIY
jgi:hypothetical protein